MEVTIEAAYGEACKALGEMVVRERLLLAELGRKDQQLETLVTQLAGRESPAGDTAA